MWIQLLVAALHLLALAIGFGAIGARARALRGTLDATGVREVLHADNHWGIAALLWISTGLARAFTGLEKGPAYYLHNHLFWEKMSLLVLILALEIWPMVTLIRWRVARARGEAIDTSRARLFARISTIQMILLVGMVALAVSLARGLGY